MAKAVNGGGNAVSEFVQGFVGEAGEGASTARVLGDLAGAITPIVGEKKAFSDLFVGLREKDTAKIIGGLVQLVPVAGAVGRTGVRTGEKLAGEVAEKGLSATALRLKNAAARAAQDQLADPKTRKKLEAAALEVGQIGLTRLVTRLEAMGANGESPDVVTREHTNFVDARNAAVEGMGAKPTPKWFDMIDFGEDGSRQVVGRHEMSAEQDSKRGMRFFGPEGEDGTTRIMWWNNPDRGDMQFGVETAPTTSAEFDAIMRAYGRRKSSFKR